MLRVHLRLILGNCWNLSRLTLVLEVLILLVLKLVVLLIRSLSVRSPLSVASVLASVTLVVLGILVVLEELGDLVYRGNFGQCFLWDLLEEEHQLDDMKPSDALRRLSVGVDDPLVAL